MSTYRIYNGTDWVSICTCTLNVLNNNNEWVEINPQNCQVRFWNGNEWCLIECETEEIED